jgi:hypothetical protein
MIKDRKKLIAKAKKAKRMMRNKNASKKNSKKCWTRQNLRNNSRLVDYNYFNYNSVVCTYIF